MSSILLTGEAEKSDISVILEELENFSAKTMEHLEQSVFANIVSSIPNTKNKLVSLEWLLIKVLGATITSCGIPTIKLLPYIKDTKQFHSVLLHKTSKLAEIVYKLDNSYNIKICVQGNPTYRLNELGVVVQAYRKLF